MQRGSSTSGAGQRLDDVKENPSVATLGSGTHALSPLFMAGHRVITAIREMGRNRMIIRLLALLLGASLSACETRDSSLDAHRQLVTSPSGSRQVTISRGPCPGSAPQILIGFEHGAGGAGVFAVNDSVLSASARWIGEDTVEITYPAGARVAKQENRAQYGAEHVTVRYATQAAAAQ